VVLSLNNHLLFISDKKKKMHQLKRVAIFFPSNYHSMPTYLCPAKQEEERSI